MSDIEQVGLTRREMMTGLGLGAGAGLVIAAGLPLTAAAAPPTNVPAWSAFPKDLGPTNPTLSYAYVDGFEFRSPNSPADVYVDAGNVGLNSGGTLIAPLALPVGAEIRQVNLACRASDGTELTLELHEKVFEVDATTGPALVAPLASLTGAAGVITTATNTLASPITLGHGRTYLLSIELPAGNSIRGVTIGYVAPLAGFVPFSGPTPRVLDTRTTGTRLTFQQEIEVDLGNPGVRGALFNLTVTETQNGGFVAAFAADIDYPGNSSVNYTATGQTVANGVVCAVSPDGKIKLRGGGPTGSAHVIVDRLGWFI